MSLSVSAVEKKKKTSYNESKGTESIYELHEF